MKKITLLFFTFIIYCSFHTAFAQDVGDNKCGPVPKVKLERSDDAFESDLDLQAIGYAYSSIQENILSIPAPCSFTQLAPWSSSGYLSSMCQGGDGNYYVTEISGPLLFQLDTVNITFILLGNITGMGTDQPNGIAYNPVNGTYYIASSSKLFSFDVNTRQATLIGSFNTGGLMIDLCFDENGICYAYDVGTDNGYIIDITTGNANLLGPLGYDANYGQGMSYDYQTGTIYLSAFNNSTFTGQCRIMDPVTGMTTLITDWGFEQIDVFALPGIPCVSIVGQPTNLNPPYGATNIPVAGVTLEWINGVYTINVEVWFGTLGNVIKVYDGPAITSWGSDTLLYSTHYWWRIICKDTTCGGSWGPTWMFTTEGAPGVVLIEPFNDLLCWNWIGPVGQTNWSNPTTNNAGGTAPELQCSWTPAYVGLNQLISCPINTITGHNHEFRFKYMYDWYADPAPLHGIAITYDGGVTSSLLWEQTIIGGNSGPEEIVLQYIPTSSIFQLIIYNNGDSFNMDYIYYDDVQIIDLDYVPVELISFNCEVKEDVVNLFWQTATETNNQGFEIFRFAQNDIESWERIGFVEGKGTTTEPQSYSFTDKTEPGKYKYRLKQIDFNGSYEYSQAIEAEVLAPLEFSLEQNYPNPFNPITVIKYSIPQASKIELKVFDILGNEIETLVNEEKQPGRYDIEFNAKAIPSGVYFYQLKAGSYIETKKMILLK